MKESGSWAPAAWRKAAAAEKRKVGRRARARETCVVRLSSDVEAGGKRLRGTAQAMGRPARRLKAAEIRRVQRPPTELRSVRMMGEKTRAPMPPPARI
jgi:CRISPR/Cas system-associated exonuclease Cas4 (RecB family)